MKIKLFESTPVFKFQAKKNIYILLLQVSWNFKNKAGVLMIYAGSSKNTKPLEAWFSEIILGQKKILWSLL